MKILYKSVTGDYYVEVDDNWGELALGKGAVVYNGKPLRLGETATLEVLVDEFNRIDRNNYAKHHRRLDEEFDNDYELFEHSDDEYRETELREFRERALATLSPRNQLMWRQRHVEDMTVEEIAERNGTTISAVYKQLNRINDKLKKFYKENFN